ncbi:hypothetical protein [Faecalibacter macacae]|nr:hypothetical protein [Faecalibacter macacae]
MQNWKDLYLELSDKINENLSDIRWIDLWHNQVNFLETEHPFPTPAVFLAFRSKAIDDVGNNVQNLTLQVDVYLYFETFSDTFRGSHNQESALDFLTNLNDIYALLQGSSGENYSNMRRTDIHPVDTGNAGNLYRQVFECVLMDYAACKIYDDTTATELIIDKQNNRYII